MLSLSFRRLAGANLLAQSAEQLSLAAVPIVAVLLLQAGPGEIGFLASVQSLPFLLLSMPLGLLADRTSRKHLMALAEALRAVALLLLFTLVVTEQVTIVALAVIGFWRRWAPWPSVWPRRLWCLPWSKSKAWLRPTAA